jgi:trigger factor
MKAREAVLEDILSRHSFDVPECLVDDELRNRAQRLASSLSQQGIDVNQTTIDWKKLFQEERPRAEQAVRRSMVLDAIGKQEGIEVSDAEIDEHLETIAKGTQKSAAAVRAQFEKDKRIQGLTELLRHNKTLEFIYRNANITGGD